MTAYLIRRLFQMVIVIFVVSLFMYFLFSIAPGGPLDRSCPAAAAHHAGRKGAAARAV